MIDVEAIKEYLKNKKDDRVQVRVPNARLWMAEGLKNAIGEDYQWLPEYNQIGDWLENNQGKGLLMYGNCGRGKSVLGEQIIPWLINQVCKTKDGYAMRVAQYSYKELNTRLEDIKQKKIIYLDDIGQETEGKIYGNNVRAFDEIVDECEKNGKLLIVSTNLMLAEMEQKYGSRVFSRLKGLTKTVKFEGQDLRG